MASNALDLPGEFFSEYPRSKIRFVNGFIPPGDVFSVVVFNAPLLVSPFLHPSGVLPPKKQKDLARVGETLQPYLKWESLGVGRPMNIPLFFRINTHGTQLLFGFVNGVYHPTSRPLKNIGTIMINHRNWGTLFLDTLWFWYFFYCNGRLTHVCRRHSRNLPWPLNFTHR